MSVKPKVTFVARYYPPSPNINGESVCDMVQYLQENYGIECTIICMDREFEGKGGSSRQPVGNVIRLRTLFKSDRKLFRFFTFLYDGFVLTRHSLRYKNSLIVVTTSPPMLPMWASLLYGRKVKWALWTLDLFPEGFEATGIISKTNFLYKWVKKKTYASHPAQLICLGPKQAEHIRNEFQLDIPTSVLPCGVFFYQDKSDMMPSWWDNSKIILGYCGNVHDAHNPEFIKAVADNLDPQKHLLVVALYGTKAPALKEYLKDKPGVVITDNVPRNQLHFIDVHMVSLVVKWTHIAVPSKAVSAISMGCPILFCGSEQSDNWHMFRKAGWLIDEQQDIQQQVKNFMAHLTQAGIDEKKQMTAELYTHMQQQVLTTYSEVAQQINATQASQ